MLVEHRICSLCTKDFNTLQRIISEIFLFRGIVFNSRFFFDADVIFSIFVDSYSSYFILLMKKMGSIKSKIKWIIICLLLFFLFLFLLVFSLSAFIVIYLKERSKKKRRWKIHSQFKLCSSSRYYQLTLYTHLFI